MDSKEIITKIQDALKKLSDESGIDKKNIRIKLSLEKNRLLGNSLKITIMNNKEHVKDIKLGDFIHLNACELIVVGGFLKNTLSKKASESDILIEHINARIFTKTDDCYPSVYLFDLGKPIKEITLQELMP